jgi:hypothetical protein
MQLIPDSWDQGGHEAVKRLNAIRSNGIAIQT